MTYSNNPLIELRQLATDGQLRQPLGERLLNQADVGQHEALMRHLAMTGQVADIIWVLERLPDLCVASSIALAVNSNHPEAVETFMPRLAPKEQHGALLSVAKDGPLECLEKMWPFYRPEPDKDGVILAVALVHNSSEVVDFLSARVDVMATYRSCLTGSPDYPYHFTRYKHRIVDNLSRLLGPDEWKKSLDDFADHDLPCTRALWEQHVLQLDMTPAPPTHRPKVRL